MIKYLVWDFDGTIADTDLCVLNNIKDVMKMYGIVESDEMILDAMKRQSSSVAVKYMADKYHKFTVEEFYEKYSEISHTYKNYENIKLNDGVKEVMEYVKGIGGKNFVVTNREDTVLHFLDVLGVSELIEDVEYIGKDGYNDWKPSPLMIERLVIKYNLVKTQVLSIGDRALDYTASKEAGLKTCLYRAVYDNTKITPDYSIINMIDIIDIIKSSAK